MVPRGSSNYLQRIKGVFLAPVSSPFVATTSGGLEGLAVAPVPNAPKEKKQV
jgi:hypothetical protein